MAEVIRWSTGENMKNNTGERERERDRHTHEPLLLPCTALFTSSARVNVQNSFDLSWIGRPIFGQHNRCCFEIMGSFELCRAVYASLLLHHLCI